MSLILQLFYWKYQIEKETKSQARPHIRQKLDIQSSFATNTSTAILKENT